MVTKKQSRATPEVSLRQFWLASLGATVTIRREARNAIESALDEADKLRTHALSFASDAKAVARGGLLTARERIEPKLGQFSAEVRSRLAPVLDKLGLKANARPASRKRRKSATKKTTRRSGSARQKTARRSARKG